MYKLLCQRFIYQNKSLFPVTYIRIQEYKNETKEKLKKMKVANVKKYWFNRYIDYIKNYDRILEKNFPQTMKMYRVFATGTKDFIKEVIKYVSILNKPSNDLTTEELRLTYTMGKDLIKMCPVLLISAVPFTNYVLFPLIYYFPRYFLTSHYWTPEQKLQFMVLDHKKRLKHNRPLFRCMQTEVRSIKDQSLKVKWNDIIACLGSGTHPSVEDILKCSELFAGPPYAINNLKNRHTKELLAIHGIPTWRPFRKQKLIDRGMFIKQMDKSIQNEGGVMKLSEDAICWALSFRGVNPANMPLENMQNWLTQWFMISNNVNENTISLLLHCPILLAYNHPTNWILIYS